MCGWGAVTAYKKTAQWAAQASDAHLTDWNYTKWVSPLSMKNEHAPLRFRPANGYACELAGRSYG
jgi:hypothetical protein